MCIRDRLNLASFFLLVKELIKELLPTLDLPKNATSLLFCEGNVSRDTHDLIN